MRIAPTISALAALLFLAAAPAQAQIFRAYLTLDGSDSNPCTLSLPCRLLPAALTAVADGGEIWMLDSANYNTGPVTIANAVTILAVPGALGSVVANGGDALTITATGPVTLRNLNILPFSGNNNRVGVWKTSAGTLTVQDCNVFGLQVGVVVQGAGNATVMRSVFRDNVTGIQAVDGATVGVWDTLFANHEGYAGRAVGNVSTTRLSITRSVSHNTLGVAFSAEAGNAGSVLLDVSEARIEGNDATATGIYLFTSPGSVGIVNVSNSAINALDFGVYAFGNGTTKLFLAGNTITNNVTGVAQLGTAVAESAGNNAIRNNTVDVSGTLTGVGPL